MKEIQYRNLGARVLPSTAEYSRVLYSFVSGRCVFTSVTPPPTTTTINAAEWIIEAICAQEKIMPDSVIFCDLQTKIAYGNLSDFQSQSFSRFQYDEITLECGPRFPMRPMHVPGAPSFEITKLLWKAAPCPGEVVRTFAHLIGPNPLQWDGNGPFDPELRNRSDKYR